MIADNMSVSALIKLANNGEKEELVKRLGGIINAKGDDVKKSALKANPQLSRLLELAVPPKKPKGKKKTGLTDVSGNPIGSDAEQKSDDDETE
jgi:hypothetical protein